MTKESLESYTVSPHDLMLARRHKLEPSEVWAMRHYIPFDWPHPVVFDVGYGSGRWTKCLHDCMAGCKVHAFEPKIRLGDAGAGIETWPDYVGHLNACAVGAQVGTAPFFRSLRYPDLDSFFRRAILDEKNIPLTQEMVPVVTIDSYSFTHSIHKIHFLKIDVEGAELEVLRGASRMLKYTDVIQFEYGGTWQDAGTKLSDALELLKDRKIFRMSATQISEGPGAEDFRYCNYLAVLSS